MCWTFSEIQSLRWRNKRILKRIDLNVKKVQKTLNNDNESEIFSKFLRRIDSNVNAIKMTLGKIVEYIHTRIGLEGFIFQKKRSQGI